MNIFKLNGLPSEDNPYVSFINLILLQLPIMLSFGIWAVKFPMDFPIFCDTG